MAKWQVINEFVDLKAGARRMRDDVLEVDDERGDALEKAGLVRKAPDAAAEIEPDPPADHRGDANESPAAPARKPRPASSKKA